MQCHSSRARRIYWAIPLIVLGCATIVGVGASWESSSEEVCLGLLLGTMFGQSAVAAAWGVLGPLRALVRIVATPVWLAMIAGSAIAFLMLLDIAELWLRLMFAGIACVESTIVGGALAIMTLYFGIRLRQADAEPLGAAETRLQFGIRHLLIVTTVVGVLLGAGRALFTLAGSSRSYDSSIVNTIVIVTFMALAAIAVQLPLLIAALLPRHALLAVLGVVVFGGVVTVGEMPLWKLLQVQGAVVRPAHFVWINAVTTMWTLSFLGVVRAAGYRFLRIDPTRL